MNSLLPLVPRPRIGGKGGEESGRVKLPCLLQSTRDPALSDATSWCAALSRSLMVVVRVRCGGEGGCVRLTALGLLAGCMIGALFELLQGPSVVSAIQPERSARALSLGGQPGRVQAVPDRSVSGALVRPLQRPPQRKTEPVVAEPSVAVCVGGWLELTYPRNAQSVADNVFSVMPAEAFVAGTLRGGNVTTARTSAALAGISALRPWFARTSVIIMPTPAELRTALEGSGHFRDYETQASKGGSGRFDFKRPDSADPTTCVPILMYSARYVLAHVTWL